MSKELLEQAGLSTPENMHLIATHPEPLTLKNALLILQSAGILDQ